ncbi:acetyltransferase [Vibrio mimicus]
MVTVVVFEFSVMRYQPLRRALGLITILEDKWITIKIHGIYRNGML